MAKRRPRKPRQQPAGDAASGPPAPGPHADGSGAGGSGSASAVVASQEGVSTSAPVTPPAPMSPVQDFFRNGVAPTLPLAAGNTVAFAAIALVVFGGVRAYSLNSGLALTFDGSIYDELMFGFMILLWASAGWLFLGLAIRSRTMMIATWSPKQLINMSTIGLAVGAAIVVQGAQWLLVRDPSVFQGLAGLPPFLLLPLIIVVLGVGVPALAIKPLAARDGAVGLPGKPFWIRFGRPALAFWGAIVGSLLAAWLFGAVISVVIVGVLRQSWYGDIFTAPDSLFDLVVPALVTLFVVPPVGGALFARLTAPTAAPASSAVSM